MNLIIECIVHTPRIGGASGCGVRLIDAQAARAIHEAGYLLGSAKSHQAAGYAGLLKALELVGPLKPTELEIRCADAVLIGQITGAETIEDAELQAKYEQVAGVLLGLDTWRLTVLSGAEAKRGEQLAGRAIELGQDVVELGVEDSPRRQRERHTGLPQWTVRLLDDPGRDCPAGCGAGHRYPFGPDTPAGFCLHAMRVVMVDGPLNWPADQQSMTTLCPNCDVPLRMDRVVER